jgi:predicted RNA binding protein YcfA (HicA-like mRNA interferase family)
MSRRDFERHLREHGCFHHHHHHRGSHDIWVNPANGTQAPVLRHKTLKRGTVRAICQRLEVPSPF